MRCLFCKKPSDLSRSREHIIPESLGNKSYLLPPGVVCDQCNNYFARKVEAPFLNSEEVLLLRFEQALESKKGRVPPAQGMAAEGVPIKLHRNPKEDFRLEIDLPPEAFERFCNRKKGIFFVPMARETPTGSLRSRFLAKVALEAMAERLLEDAGGVDYLVDDPQFDIIRDHARRGTTPIWPTSSRRIYDAHARWWDSDAEGSDFQIVYEYDFLVTDRNEYFFVVSLFGEELAINMGGPEIGGYQEWLEHHGGASPLYHGKNERPTYQMASGTAANEHQAGDG
jgi:hypothetical protein